MWIRLTRFAVFLLLIWLVLSIPPLSAQGDGDLAPRQGPPGAPVAVFCSDPSEVMRAYYTDFSEDIPLDSQGIGYYTIRQDAFPGETVNFICSLPGSEIFTPTASFTVTDCGLSSEANLSAIFVSPLTASHYRSSFVGDDLGVDSSGLFGHTIDVTNSAGQTLRLTIRSADPSLLLNYMNGLQVDFNAVPVSPGNAVGGEACNSDVGFLSQSPDTGTIVGDIDMEMILLVGGSVTGGQYVVSYEIDPEVRTNQLHTYRPIEAGSASAGVTASQGRVKLTMWNNANYVNAIVHAPNLPKLPSLVNSVAPNRAEYFTAVRGMDSNNRYTIRGSFGTEPCPAASRECGNVIPPQLRLLQGGTGMSDRSPMNDGNFQVEGYCTQGYIQGYPAVSHDNNNWYCNRSTGSSDKVRLTQANFTEICQITYNTQNAVAISDRGESIPAFNWRCFSR